MLENQKVAVLGGAGFLGSRLCVGKENDIYTAFDICNVSNRVTYLDVEKPETLDQLAGFNSIINLSAEHHDDISPLSRYDDVNVQGAVNVCNADRKHGIDKIILTSLAIHIIVIHYFIM